MRLEVLFRSVCVLLTWCRVVSDMSEKVRVDLLTPMREYGETCGYESCPLAKRGHLNVHIVPHTHGEMGHGNNFDEHFTGEDEVFMKSQANMKQILDQVLTELWKKSTRKFTLADNAFLFHWWSKRDATVHRMVYELIRQGRLTFVGGGYSMSDEASTSYHGIIDQFTYSLRKMNATFLECGRPLVAWQSEVFGHSKEFTSLMAQMGFDGLFIHPISFDDEVARMQRKGLEFVWRGSDDLGAASDIFTHKLFDGYWSPPGFCFGRFCKDPLIVTSDTMFTNVNERVEEFINSVRYRQAPHYGTKNIMMMMGHRWGYFDAITWFSNIEKLIDATNKRSVEQKLNISVFYSNPACYLKAVHDANPILETKQDDFFPFVFDRTSYTVGMYTSRPTLKYIIREGLAYLQITKQLEVLANLGNNDKLFEKFNWITSVMQDHTIATGALRVRVKKYYVKKMYSAISKSTELMSSAFRKLRNGTVYIQYNRCLFNISSCDDTRVIKHSLQIYNPLGWPVTIPVRLPVRIQNSKFFVYDLAGKVVKSVTMKIPSAIMNIKGRGKADHEVVFIAENLPPLGFRSYYVQADYYRPKREIIKKLKLSNPKKYLIRQIIPLNMDDKLDDLQDYDDYDFNGDKNLKKSNKTETEKELLNNIDYDYQVSSTTEELKDIFVASHRKTDVTVLPTQEAIKHAKIETTTAKVTTKIATTKSSASKTTEKLTSTTDLWVENVTEVVENVIEAVESATEVVETVTEGVENATDVVENFTEVVENVTEVVENVTEAVEKITEAAESITEVVENVTEVVENVTEIVENVTEAVENVTTVVGNVTTSTEAIKVIKKTTTMAPKTTTVGVKYFKSSEDVPQNNLFIANKYVRLSLDSRNRIASVNLCNGVKMTLNIELYFYVSDEPAKLIKDNLDKWPKVTERAPGVFVFRTMDPQREMMDTKYDVKVVKNEIVEELHVTFNEWAFVRIRLYADSPVLEVNWLVGPIPIEDNLGKDVFIRYTTDLKNEGVFYTDSNGRQTIKRIRNMRATYEPVDLDHLAGNLYPVTSKIYIEDLEKNIRFSIFNDRCQAGGSLKDGTIDMMVHRRILTDDIGIQTELNETEYDEGIKVIGTHYLYLTKADYRKNRIFEKKFAKEIDLGPKVFASDKHYYKAKTMKDEFFRSINEFSGLKAKLSVGVHLLTFEKWSDGLLIRLENYLEKSDVLKTGVKIVFLKDMFSNIEIVSAREMTLGANMYKSDYVPLQWLKGKFYNSFNDYYGSTENATLNFDFSTLTDDFNLDSGIKLVPQQIRTFLAQFRYIE